MKQLVRKLVDQPPYVYGILACFACIVILYGAIVQVPGELRDVKLLMAGHFVSFFVFSLVMVHYFERKKHNYAYLKTFGIAIVLMILTEWLPTFTPYHNYTFKDTLYGFIFDSLGSLMILFRLRIGKKRK